MERVVLAPHPKFSSWCAAENPDYMFSEEQRKAWSAPHLKACHWYVEMNPKETPPHEEENRKSVEPSFIFEAPLAFAVAEGPNKRAT